MRARLSFCLALALLLATPPRAQDAASQWRDIDIASEGARPPYNYLDANGQLAGFEIDLGRELCRRMAARCRFVAQDWDNLIPGLLAGQYDAVMAALDITDERLQQIAFSRPYLRMPQAFVTRRALDLRDISPKALEGRSIGVEADGPHQTYLETIYPSSQIRPYGSFEEAMLDLAEGRVDLVFGDRDAAGDFLKSRKEGRCCRLVATLPRSPAFFGEGFGIGLRPSDGGLKAAFDEALGAAMADGTYDRLRAPYWDFDTR